MLEKYHPLWINLHFNHPERDHARGQPRRRQAREGRTADRQPERAAGGRQRLRPHPAGARAQAGRQPDPAVLPLPVRPRRGLRPLPHAGRQGPRDHGGPARPHLGLRGPDLRHRRARRRRQDPGHAQLPDQLLRPQGGAAQLRGLHHDLRGAAHVRRRTTSPPAPTASTSARSRASPACWGCSRASGCGSSRATSGRPTPVATPRRIASRTRPSGSRSGSGPSKGARAAPLRVLEPGPERREYGPGEEPRPREGEPTGSAHGELL